jgi:ribose transport system substrate-binding protein
MFSKKARRAQPLLLLLALSGCRPQPPTIAVIPRATGVGLWETERVGAKAAAHQIGYQIYWNAPSREDDIERQISLVERVVRNRVQGLVLAPDHTLALMTPVRRAIAQGIPVVIVSSPLSIPPGGKLIYIVNDEEQVGYMAAMRVGKILNGRGTVAVVGINPSISGMTSRLRSFEQNLSTHFPNISIADQRTDFFNSAQAQQAVEEILDAHPRLDAIVALNAMSMRGAYFALGQRHALMKIKIVGCDQDFLPPLRTGEVDSVIIENTYEMGYEAIMSIDALRQGKSVPPFIKLSPILVTKENLGQPAISRLLTTPYLEPER